MLTMELAPIVYFYEKKIVDLIKYLMNGIATSFGYVCNKNGTILRIRSAF